MNMFRFTPLKLGIIFGVLAAVMLATELAWKPVFTVRLTESIAIPVWILVAIYAALQLYLWYATKKRLPLTEEELAKWGGKLEEVTPRVVAALQAHRPLGEVAKEIEASDGIPPEVTLRYIIALVQHVKQEGQG